MYHIAGLYDVFVCCSEFGNTHLQTVSLAGVEDAYSQHSDAEPKGIKAHFRVDDSGLLYLDKVCLLLIHCPFSRCVHSIIWACFLKLCNFHAI